MRTSHVPSAVPPKTQAAGSWALLELLRLFDGCLPTSFGFSHSSRSHHSDRFSRINRDLLTKKCKQVDRPVSGHKNIHCWGWNVENAAILNMMSAAQFLSPSSFLAFYESSETKP